MQTGFADELSRWGPDTRRPAVSLARAHAYCRRLALTHYENFTVASLLLPRRLLRHFHAVYAYCRWADDLADEAGGAAGRSSCWRGGAAGCSPPTRAGPATPSSSPSRRPSGD